MFDYQLLATYAVPLRVSGGYGSLQLTLAMVTIGAWVVAPEHQSVSIGSALRWRLYKLCEQFEACVGKGATV